MYDSQEIGRNGTTIPHVITVKLFGMVTLFQGWLNVRDRGSAMVTILMQ